MKECGGAGTAPPAPSPPVGKRISHSRNARAWRGAVRPATGRRLEGTPEARHGLRHARTDGNQGLRDVASGVRSGWRWRVAPASIRGEAARSARPESVVHLGDPARPGAGAMTSNHPFRRVLARICSPDTMARVVDPTLADIRWEHRRAHWRGYVSLASALALHVISSIPARVAAVWLEDGHAVPRVTILSIGPAAIGAP